ncbi:MAG TPA: hypothetical protein VFV19_06960 [Candidatus Polarisedimenticolaceae bacterium]|nr:hypothetical protein [Candidatus Polarisedimenticolaceae bacterium]
MNTTVSDRAAIAIIGLIGVVTAVFGLGIIIVGYAVAGSSIESAKSMPSALVPGPRPTLIDLWHPAAIAGSVMTLLGLAVILARRWLVLHCVAVPDVPATQGDLGSIFPSVIVAVGLLVSAASLGALASVAVSSVVDGLGIATDSVAFWSVTLVIGCVLALRPGWVVKLAGAEKQ